MSSRSRSQLAVPGERSVAPRLGARWRRPSRPRGSDPGLRAAAALIVLGLVVAPLMVLFVQAVAPNAFSAVPNLHLSLAGLSSVFADAYALQAGMDSLLLAAATAIVATAIGTVAAYVLTLTDIPAKGALWALVWLILLAPSFLLAEGWELLLEPGGLAHGLMGGMLTRVLLSPLGVMLVLSLKLFPFATIAVASALSGLGQDVVHAARLAGAHSRELWRHVLLPLLVPALLAGGLIVFAEVLSDFGIAATLAATANFPLATYSIYASLEQFPVNFPQAAAQSLMLVAAVSVAQVLQGLASGRRSYATRWGGNQTLVPVALGRRRFGVLGIALGFIVLALVVPAATTVMASFTPSGAGGFLPSRVFTLQNYVAAWQVPYGAASFGVSLQYAVAAASLGLLASIVIALAWRHGRGWFNGMLQVFLTTAIAVPGIVLGAGYIFLWNAPGLRTLGLYGTPAVLGLAYIAGGLPYAVRVVTSSMAQVPPGALDAARLSGARHISQVRWIILPMLRDTWVRVWLMLFSGVMFELPVSQLLYPPGEPTLAVSIVHQLNGQELGRGAALTVLSTTAAGLVALGVSWGWGRMGRGRARPSAAGRLN